MPIVQEISRRVADFVEDPDAAGGFAPGGHSVMRLGLGDVGVQLHRSAGKRPNRYNVDQVRLYTLRSTSRFPSRN